MFRCDDVDGGGCRGQENEAAGRVLAGGRSVEGGTLFLTIILI